MDNKFCVEYREHSKSLASAKEIRITVKPDSKVEAIKAVLANLQDTQRLNIYLEDDIQDYIANKSLKTILDIVKETDKEYTFCLSNHSVAYAQMIDELFTDIPHYYNITICTWDDLMAFLNTIPNLSDILIAESLGFELPAIAAICSASNIKVRVYPDVAQAANLNIPDMFKFFIRPEDIEVYSKFVDVFELFHKENQETIYDIYANQKTWQSSIKEIILGLDEDAPCSKMLKFGDKRVDCGRKCMRLASSCGICDQVYKIAEGLDNLNLTLKEKENK